ncbi:MAG: ATP-binding cassette domain-containing protein [Dorea sp.]|nr:ATP-binding cassette domain-containing protein [Dorea sp.]
MIILENVTKSYTSSVVFDKFSLHVEHGEFLFVTGESGSGKSTLIKLLTKETDVTKGRILVDGKDLSKMKRREVPVYRRNLGIVFQDMKLLEDRTVFENLAFAREVIYGRRKDTSQRVASILPLLGLTRLHKRYPRQLSGGEKQKTVLARALMNDPAILLADEPTGNLDPDSSAEVMDLFEMVHKRGMTVLVATHDISQVERLGHRRLELTMSPVNLSA